MLKEALYMQMRTKYTEDPKEVKAFEKELNGNLHNKFGRTRDKNAGAGRSKHHLDLSKAKALKNRSK